MITLPKDVPYEVPVPFDSIDAIKEKAKEILYEHYKECEDRRKRNAMNGRDNNVDMELMNLQLVFRQSLSFARLIFND